MKQILFLVFLLPVFLIAQYDINGNASQISCNCYQLTEDAPTQVGSVWNQNKIDLTQSFDFIFDVYLGDDPGLWTGADGMVFGLQPISTSIGVAGGGMGIEGVTPSLGVFIDTYENGGDSDPYDDHISLNRDGDVDHATANNLQGPNTLGELEDGNWHKLRVVWDATSTMIDVYFDDVLQFSHTEDIINTIFGGDPEVFWGFTAATGGADNVHQFCTQLSAGFDFSAGVVCPGTELSFSDLTESFGGIALWEWDVDNDGTTDYTGQSATHTFNDLGDYPITLTVTDDNGCVSSITQDISVKIPDVSISASETEVCANSPVDLSSVSATDFVNCFYTLELFDSFGDGWNGNTIDVYLDGVLEGIYTLSDPPGDITSFQIDVSAATTISIEYNADGSWPEENGLTVYDNLGAVIYNNSSIWLESNPIFESTITSCPEVNAIYSWTSPSLGEFSSEENTSILLTESEDITFTVDIVDQENCSASETISLSLKPTADLVSDTIEDCFTSGITIDIETVIVDNNSMTSSLGIISYFEDNLFTIPLLDNIISSPTVIYVTKENDGCIAEAEIVFEELCEPIVLLPNVFSPNGSSGNNDLFIPKSFDFVGEHMFKVFNRWGQEVYSTNDLESGWNGTSNGKSLSSGTYYYILSYQDENGLDYEPIEGHISIF